MLLGAQPTGEVMTLPDQMGGIHAYACARCGFVRLHSAQVLDDEVPQREEE
jgi:hypothetical protein